MAKKKTAKKAVQKKSAKKGKKPAAKKKSPAKKSVAKKSVKKVARAKPAKRAAKVKPAKKSRPVARKSPAKRKRPAAPALGANQYVEKMSVAIEGPDKTGDLVATESLGDAALVHHTVHPGTEATSIPGQSYSDLKKLGEGTHEIEVVKTLTPPGGATT